MDQGSRISLPRMGLVNKSRNTAIDKYQQNILIAQIKFYVTTGYMYKNDLPAYLNLIEFDLFQHRINQAYNHLSNCDLCPNQCHVDRLAGELGVCRTGKLARIRSYGPHLGEENPLRGWCGSGTIFFTGCNLHCQYCQNHEISQSDHGDEVDNEQLSSILLELQSIGCHNINFVSPSHVVPQIIAAVFKAAQKGLRIPLVYNSGGYDSLKTLDLLDGIIDIYMPDMKYSSPQIALQYSKITDYPGVNKAAVKEMHRQVGDLTIDENGLATRGLLVRHLILPNELSGTADITKFLVSEISPNTYLNLMDQYRPDYKAQLYPKLMRPITQQEYNAALDIAKTSGLQRFDQLR